MQNIDALATKIQKAVDGTEKDKTYTYLGSDKYQQVFVDPVSIAIISTILVNVVKLFQECRKNKDEALQVSHNPGLFERRALKRTIREAVGGGQFELRKKYYDEIRNHGTEITDLEMEGIYDDYGAYSTMQYKEQCPDFN